MIPKIIHFIWVGESPLPDYGRHCLEWFKQLNPDYDVRLHGEEVLLPEYERYYEVAPQLCSKSDILRLSVLKKYGGFYFDCDFVPLRPMSDLTDKYDMSKWIFLTRQTEDPRWDQSKVIANGAIGIHQDSPAWEVIERYLKEASSKKPIRTMFGPSMMTRLVREYKEKCTVAVNRDFYVWPLGGHTGAIDFFRELVREGLTYERASAKFGKYGVPMMFHLWAGGGNKNML